MREVLDKREQKKIPTEELVQMAEFVLKNNFFEFNGQIKQQISGTAIGTKCAPTYACIYMHKMEGELLEKQKYKPFTWLRYIDDIFFIWTHGEDKLKTFLENINQFHLNIKFTHESSTESILFLDLRVKLSQGRLETDLHIKPTDRHQYLNYSFPHPGHTKQSIVYSQTLRVARVCSHEENFRKHTTEIKSWFLKRGYPNNVIEKEMKKVKSSKISSTRKDNTKVVPLVVTYHPSLKNINQIINRNLHLLYMDQEVKKVFTPNPMVSSVVPGK